MAISCLWFFLNHSAKGRISSIGRFILKDSNSFCSARSALGEYHSNGHWVGVLIEQFLRLHFSPFFESRGPSDCIIGAGDSPAFRALTTR